ncbi:MAG: DUF2207 domain-containing protein [Candidatus Berkelbacteria bacterium]
MKKYFALLVAFIGLFSFAAPAWARENVDYWYVQDFQSSIVVNNDSSIDVTENIVADCGNAQKHGIFRTLPTFQQIANSKKIQSPITLTSITDFDGKPIKYSETSSRSDGTVTWKIGDPNKTVSGINNYRIRYHVKNAIRHNSADFDEFYWNLSGNFWDMEIDNFSARINFPSEIEESNSNLSLYSGSFGDKNNLGAVAGWNSTNQVGVDYFKTLKTGEGVTLSATFPKGIIQPYVPTFWEQYGSYFYFLIPIIVFLLLYLIWKKTGRETKISPTVVPEFEIPENLSPLDMGVIFSDGSLKGSYVTAGIINLAVKGVIKIEGIKGSGILAKNDYLLTKTNHNEDGLSISEKSLLDKLFSGESETKISALKDVFYKQVEELKTEITDQLEKQNILSKKGLGYRNGLLIASIVCVFVGFKVIFANLYAGTSIFVLSIILYIFSLMISGRTEVGSKLNKRIQGFKLYMDTAERFRQKFNEKENIFEKFLPYAIMFGMTKEWVKKMKDIYGEKYFNNYHPIWFYGTGFENFDADSFASEISSMSSNMASTISSSPSSSGSGGGGFSGGGGGGGGGGGW